MDQSGLSRRRAIGWMAGGAAAAAMPTVATAEQGIGGIAGGLNVRDFGAAGDGKAKDHAAIQKAIDAATAAGGGTVVVPNGTYLCGTVRLADGVTLHLAEGATILGSTDGADYPNFPGGGTSRTPLALILAEGARKVAVTGRGRINGQGNQFEIRDGVPGRPFAVKFIDCTDVLLSDVRVEDAAAWVIHLLRCERAVVRGVRVWSHANYNNDGLDIDACTDVTVSQCHFDTQDDAICLKSTPDKVCENVTISDCFASSHCNLIKFGTSSAGGFRNVTITNCTLVAPRYSKKINGQQRGIGGINLELVDGGIMEGITISNVTMDGITLPLFIRLGDRKRTDKRPAGVLRNVVISNVIATNVGVTGSSITGVPGQAVESVALRDLQFTYEGGGTAEDARRAVPEKEKAYPEGTMFGTLPAWGLYCRHVRGLKMHNVVMKTVAADARHAVVLDEVADVDVDGLDCAYSEGAAAVVRLVNVRGVMVRGCRPAVAGVFLRVEGRESAGVAVMGNDLRGAGTWLEAGAEVAKDAVARAGNLMRE